MRPISKAMTHCEFTPRFARGCAHRITLRQCESHGLFTENILSRPQRSNRKRRVQLGGETKIDDVDSRIGKHTSRIFISGDPCEIDAFGGLIAEVEFPSTPIPRELSPVPRANG